MATHKSTKYGFSFQYPSKWNKYDDTNSRLAGITVTPKNKKAIISDDGIPKFNIIAISPNKVSADEIYTARRKIADIYTKRTVNFNSDVNIKTTEDKITIDGVTAIRVKTDNIKMQSARTDFNSKKYVLGNGYMYFFVYNGQRFIMSYVYPANEESTYKREFEKIVSSINFK